MLFAFLSLKELCGAKPDLFGKGGCRAVMRLKMGGGGQQTFLRQETIRNRPDAGFLSRLRRKQGLCLC